MEITKTIFGTLANGKIAYLYQLKNNNGISVTITDFGGAIVGLLTPDKDGILQDIVLGFDTLSSYEKQDKYLGVLVGRCCNRIQKGTFSLNGITYSLATNNGPHHLHGGLEGFDKKLLQSEITKSGLILSYESPNREEGYPGTLQVSVTYALTEDNTFSIQYRGTTDADTLCNLTNHSYFHLGKRGSAPLQEILQLHADTYTPADETAIPYGNKESVLSTPLDFTQPKPIGKEISANHPQLLFAKGYDQNFCINGYDGTLRTAATAWHPQTGIFLTMETTLPGVQLYTGNYLGCDLIEKNGFPLSDRDGFCLETQHYPNAVNTPAFPSPILKKGQVYTQTTRYHLGVSKQFPKK